VAESALVWLNWYYFDGTYWSVVVGVILAYIYLTLAYTVSYSRAGYRMKILVGVAGAVLLLAVIDRLLGNYRWSLNYVFPAALIAVDVTVLFLIIFNRRNWASYISFQILMVGWSVSSHIRHCPTWRWRQQCFRCLGHCSSEAGAPPQSCIEDFTYNQRM
jgi:fucose 4-O-acetylase-like acetyltransferase